MSPLFTLSISWRWRLPSQSSLLTNEPLSSDKFSVCIRMCQDVSGGACLGQGFQGQDGHWQRQTSENCVMRLQGSGCYFNFGDGVITRGSMSVTASQGPALCLLKFFAAASSSMSHRQPWENSFKFKLCMNLSHCISDPRWKICVLIRISELRI